MAEASIEAISTTSAQPHHTPSTTSTSPDSTAADNTMDLSATSESDNNVAGEVQATSQLTTLPSQPQLDLERHIASLMSPAAILEYINKLAKERDELRNEVNSLHTMNGELREENRVLKSGSFTCFSKLPVELRVMIWKFALPGPRIVHVQRTLDEDGWDWDGIELHSSCPIPALLHVNSESRQVALQFYSLSFGMIAIDKSHKLNAGIYCDFEQDIILFSMEDLHYWTLGPPTGDRPATLLQHVLEDADLLRIQKLGIIFAKGDDVWLHDLQVYFHKALPKEIYIAYIDHETFHLGGQDLTMEEFLHCLHEEEPLPTTYTQLRERKRMYGLGGILPELRVVLMQEKIRSEKKPRPQIQGNDHGFDRYRDFFESGRNPSEIEIPQIMPVGFFERRRAKYC